MTLQELIIKHNLDTQSELYNDIRNLFMNNLTFTCDKFEKYMSEPSKWQESVCMTFKLKPEQLKEHFKNFMKIKKLEGENGASWATPQEAQTHFLNWIRKQPVPLVVNAPSKKSTPLSAENKYNAFVNHIKVHGSIPSNADFVLLAEYKYGLEELEKQECWSKLSYSQKLHSATEKITEWANKNFEITNSNIYSSEKTSGGLSKHIQQLKENLGT